MRTFAELDRPRSRKSGCHICGASTAARVNLAVRRLGDDRLPTGAQLGSRSMSLCEHHAVEVYDTALAAMEGVGG